MSQARAQGSKANKGNHGPQAPSLPLDDTDMAQIKHALSQGWNPNRELAPGEPALGLAAGQPLCMALLLAAGADPDVLCGRLRQTPLMRAAEMGCASSVNLLLGAGARADLDDIFGRDAAWSARKANRHQLAQTLEDIAQALRKDPSEISLPRILIDPRAGRRPSVRASRSMRRTGQ